MKKIFRTTAALGLVAGALISTSASAAILEFHFTGQYTLIDSIGGYLDQQAIESTLTYDTNAGSGFSADMTIANFDTFGATATIYDISLQRHTGTNLIIGNMLVDWNSNVGIPVSMVWDATGLFNAIDIGLQAGDVISGTNLKRNDVIIADVDSATPASDGVLNPTTGMPLNQGPAPLAVTTLGTFSGGFFADDGIAGSPMTDGPFLGLNVNFDIGSGNSLTVLSVSAIPVPAAVWLFGSGLLGLAGLAKRKVKLA